MHGSLEKLEDNQECVRDVISSARFAKCRSVLSLLPEQGPEVVVSCCAGNKPRLSCGSHPWKQVPR